MKSALVYGPRDIRFVEEPMPVLGDDDVMTRVKYVGLCGTDKSVYDGKIAYLRNGLMRYPVRLGHEWSGVVCAVGKNVKGFRVGENVCGDNVVTCGACEKCKAGNYAFCENLRAVGSVHTWPGAFAQFMVMPQRHMFHLPGGVSLEEGALIEPAATGLYTALNARIAPGCTAVVHGTGVIGIVAAQCAKVLGAGRVIITGRSEKKLEVCKALGVDLALNARQVDVTQTILNLTEGKGAPSIMETTGAASVLLSCIEQAAPQGVISVIGSYDAPVDGFDANGVVYKNLTITGLNGCPNMFDKLLSLLAAGRVALKPLITNVIPFEKIAQALEGMNADKARIKILIQMPEDQ